MFHSQDIHPHKGVPNEYRDILFASEDYPFPLLTVIRGTSRIAHDVSMTQMPNCYLRFDPAACMDVSILCAIVTANDALRSPYDLSVETVEVDKAAGTSRPAEFLPTDDISDYMMTPRTAPLTPPTKLFKLCSRK